MDRDHRLRSFRLRLLAAFGVGMAPGLFYSGDVEAESLTTACYTLAQGEVSCASADESDYVLMRLDQDDGDTGGDCTFERKVERALVDAFDPNRCCYKVWTDSSCSYDSFEEECGCYGRPYVAEAEVVSAPAVRNPSWGTRAAPELVPELAGLAPEQRAALAEFWRGNARAEHSSVAGFHRICLELIAHAAPLELLERSQKAAADELAHARICYALASHYADEPLGPGPMAIGASAPIAASLVELARATAREGCLAETSAAWLASEMAARARDPAVRAALGQIAQDEAEHAELAWMTLRWAIEAGGEPVRQAVAEVFASARPATVAGAAMNLTAHGMLDHAEVTAIVEQSFRAILVPLMRSAAA